jgi:hypothetical protein
MQQEGGKTGRFGECSEKVIGAAEHQAQVLTTRWLNGLRAALLINLHAETYAVSSSNQIPSRPSLFLFPLP